MQPRPRDPSPHPCPHPGQLGRTGLSRGRRRPHSWPHAGPAGVHSGLSPGALWLHGRADGQLREKASPAPDPRDTTGRPGPRGWPPRGRARAADPTPRHQRLRLLSEPPPRSLAQRTWHCPPRQVCPSPQLPTPTLGSPRGRAPSGTGTGTVKSFSTAWAGRVCLPPTTGRAKVWPPSWSPAPLGSAGLCATAHPPKPLTRGLGRNRRPEARGSHHQFHHPP